jgi:hypothetical protein
VTRAHPPDTTSDQDEPCSSFAVVSWWWSPPFVPAMYPEPRGTDPARLVHPQICRSLTAPRSQSGARRSSNVYDVLVLVRGDVE